MTISKTKKAFMLASGIIGIVAACLAVFVGLVLLALKSADIYDIVVEILNASGVQYSNYTADELRAIVSLCQAIYGVVGIFAIAFGIGMLVCSIIVVKNATKLKSAKGATIALLTFSVLCVNVLTLGFTITVLCMKDKQTEAQLV